MRLFGAKRGTPIRGSALHREGRLALERSVAPSRQRKDHHKDEKQRNRQQQSCRDTEQDAHDNSPKSRVLSRCRGPRLQSRTQRIDVGAGSCGEARAGAASQQCARDACSVSRRETGARDGGTAFTAVTRCGNRAGADDRALLERARPTPHARRSVSMRAWRVGHTRNRPEGSGTLPAVGVNERCCGGSDAIVHGQRRCGR
jgi:hypothetical protein